MRVTISAEIESEDDLDNNDTKVLVLETIKNWFIADCLNETIDGKITFWIPEAQVELVV